MQPFPSKQANDDVGGTSRLPHEDIPDQGNDRGRLMFAQRRSFGDGQAACLAIEKFLMVGPVLGRHILRHGGRQAVSYACVDDPALDLQEGAVLIREIDYVAHRPSSNLKSAVRGNHHERTTAT